MKPIKPKGPIYSNRGAGIISSGHTKPGYTCIGTCHWYITIDVGDNVASVAALSRGKAANDPRADCCPSAAKCCQTSESIVLAKLTDTERNGVHAGTTISALHSADV